MILQATQQLLDELPSYAELTRTVASPQPAGLHEPQGKEVALWMCDSILAARVQFLMSVLGPCLPALSQVRFLKGSVRWPWTAAADCALLYAVQLSKTRKSVNYESWKTEALCEQVVAADVILP